ncbi:MAG: HEAT repeat domain-containing protein [Kofleriaceae bacterium]
MRTALLVAPDVDDAYVLLGPLAEQADSWNRATAAHAADAARQIARRLGPRAPVAADVDDDELEARQTRYLALAQRADRWPDVRVAALEVVAALATVRARGEDLVEPGYDLTALLADPEPELRRAAAELLPSPTTEAQRPALVRALLDDPVPAVSLAAAQALCGDLVGLGAGDPEAVLGAIGPLGLERLRGFVSAEDAGDDPDLPVAALLDAARCLAAAGGKDDRAAIRALGRHGPRAVRDILAGWELD